MTPAVLILSGFAGDIRPVEDDAAEARRVESQTGDGRESRARLVNDGRTIAQRAGGSDSIVVARARWEATVRVAGDIDSESRQRRPGEAVGGPFDTVSTFARRVAPPQHDRAFIQRDVVVVRDGTGAVHGADHG